MQLVKIEKNIVNLWVHRSSDHKYLCLHNGSIVLGDFVVIKNNQFLKDNCPDGCLCLSVNMDKKIPANELEEIYLVEKC